MEGLKYDHKALSDITTGYDSDIKDLSKKRERLALDIANIKSNWSDEESAIAERDRDFKIIEESVDKIIENFNTTNKFLRAKDEAFHEASYKS